MSEIAIRVEKLGKRYRIGGPQARYKTIRESLVEAVQAPMRGLGKLLRGAKRAGNANVDSMIWALRDVSFEVKPGEVVGIIGRNGAGKSTLLKILSRITKPTEGYAEIHGRVGSLLEVGTGFHPELTGRENIYLNGAILGMKWREIENKFDEIVDFAEIEKFIDTPVKHYSSGMYVRLAFAVAAHLEPEILLVDEVLAVGDAAFQKKCLGKMDDVAKTGRTVLFVSHNMAAISALCGRVVVLEAGRVYRDGSPASVIPAYIASISSLGNQGLANRVDRQGTGHVRITDFGLENAEGQRQATLRTGDDAYITLSFESQQDSSPQDPVFSFSILSQLGEPLMLCRNDYTGDHFQTIRSSGKVKCIIPHFPLMPGIFHVNVYAESRGEVLDWVRYAATLEVVEGDFYGTGRLPPSGHAPILVAHRWRIDDHA